MLVFVFVSGNLSTYAVALTIALLHESGHMVAALICGYGVKGIKIQPFGVGLVLKDSNIDDWHEILIACAGPAVNIILIIAGICFLKLNYSFSRMFYVTNVYMLCINLLPVLPLDGGRVLSATLRMEFDEAKANRIIRGVSVVCTAVVLLFGIVYFIKSETNISLFIAALFLLDNIQSHNDKSHNITSVYYSEQICVNAKTFCVEESMCVREVLKVLPFENAEVILVTDSDGKITSAVTNKYILKLLTNGYSDFKLADVCKLNILSASEEI